MKFCFVVQILSLLLFILTTLKKKVNPFQREELTQMLNEDQVRSTEKFLPRVDCK